MSPPKHKLSTFYSSAFGFGLATGFLAAWLFGVQFFLLVPSWPGPSFCLWGRALATTAIRPALIHGHVASGVNVSAKRAVESCPLSHKGPYLPFITSHAFASLRDARPKTAAAPRPGPRRHGWPNFSGQKLQRRGSSDGRRPHQGCQGWRWCHPATDVVCVHVSEYGP